MAAVMLLVYVCYVIVFVLLVIAGWKLVKKFHIDPALVFLVVGLLILLLIFLSNIGDIRLFP